MVLSFIIYLKNIYLFNNVIFFKKRSFSNYVLFHGVYFHQCLVATQRGPPPAAGGGRGAARPWLRGSMGKGARTEFYTGTCLVSQIDKLRYALDRALPLETHMRQPPPRSGSGPTSGSAPVVVCGYMSVRVSRPRARVSRDVGGWSQPPAFVRAHPQRWRLDVPGFQFY